LYVYNSVKTVGHLSKRVLAPCSIKLVQEELQARKKMKKKKNVNKNFMCLIQ